MEGEIGRRIAQEGIATSLAAAGIEVASRTDRGVSARANAMAVRSALGATALLRALNGVAPDIRFTAAREVPEAFRVRSAVRRVYRYFEPSEHHDFRIWTAIATKFTGSVDVRSFGRGIPADRPMWRTVEAVTVRPVPGGAVIEVRAPSFVWGMVRKIISSFREVEAGRLSIDRLDAALQGHLRLTLPLAEPERLVLWEVEYADPWEYTWTGPNRHQKQWEAQTGDGLWVRKGILGALADLSGRPRP